MKIQLSDGDFLAQGRHRACFVHPGNAARCIKVQLPTRRSTDQNGVESDYYNYLRRRGVSFSHIAACHGWVETDRGRGLVYDRVYLDNLARPEFGALDLRKAILDNVLDDGLLEELLAELVDYLRRNSILWCDENPSNICVALRPRPRLVIIDGLGGRKKKDLRYRLFKRIPLFARLYTRPKIGRLYEKVRALQAQRNTRGAG